MNKKKWDSLPKEVQQVIEEVNKEWIEKTGKAWDEFDKIGKEYALSKGGKVIKLTKEEDERWAKAVRPVLEEYAAAMKAKGLPGERVPNLLPGVVEKQSLIHSSPVTATLANERPYSGKERENI